MEWEKRMHRGVVTSSIAKIGSFRLSVHHFIDCGDTWFMSCYGIFDRVTLGEMPLEYAQTMAVARLQLKFEEAVKIIVDG